MKQGVPKQVNKELKAVSRKVILLGATLLLLLSMLVYFTVAWYTKMVSVSGMQFQAAKWDFTANMSISDMTVNVYEYTTLQKGYAAPGSAGWIPINLGARQSDTDVEYTIMVDRSTMSSEFQQRIFFYYHEKDANGNEKKDANGNPVKVYFCGSPQNPNSEMQLMTGRIPKGQSVNVMIYWEWIYESPSEDEAVKEQWDRFDTAVGRNPALYISSMNAKLTIAGVEVNPENNRVSAS